MQPGPWCKIVRTVNVSYLQLSIVLREGNSSRKLSVDGIPITCDAIVHGVCFDRNLKTRVFILGRSCHVGEFDV